MTANDGDEPVPTDPGRDDVATVATMQEPVSIHPAPSVEEAAAIVAAIEALWPRPTASVVPPHDRSTTWRFSGRWWRRDRMAPVDRPWS